MNQSHNLPYSLSYTDCKQHVQQIQKRHFIHFWSSNYSTMLNHTNYKQTSISTKVMDDVYAWRILSSAPFHYCKYAWPSQSLLSAVADKVSHRTCHVELSPIPYHYEVSYAYKHTHRVTSNLQNCTCWLIQKTMWVTAVTVDGFDLLSIGQEWGPREMASNSKTSQGQILVALDLVWSGLGLEDTWPWLKALAARR